jgi:phosphate starvation-inducible PhoH-like protein
MSKKSNNPNPRKKQHPSKYSSREQALPEVDEPKTFNHKIKPRTDHQAEYIQAIQDNDLVFGIGPAGTGKTFLAVAQAIEYLRCHKVERIVIARPAVAAGEELGALPGNFQEKVDPYLRPVYDALYTLSNKEEIGSWIETGKLEIAAIAFLRGRTLSNAFVIMDESQNTTYLQMKMILTRIGSGSKMIVNGDLTQVDLKKNLESGLITAEEILKNVKNTAFQFFDDSDVQRCQLVRDIVNSYEDYENPESIE